MDLRIDTSEFVERNSPHKSWVRQPLHRNQNLYNRLIRALVADNAEDKFRFPENHPEISRNIKSRVYKKPSIRSDMIIEDFLGKYTEQILDDCAAFRRNNTLWLSCPKSPSLKDIWRKSIIPNQLLLNGYTKKRSRYSSKYLTSESESESPPELTAETYDCFNKQSKKTKISSPHDDDVGNDDDDNYSRLHSKPDEICLSDLNYSRDNNSFNRISESTELLLGDDLLTEKAMHCLLDYYYYQQKDDQFRGCFKIMPLNSSFDDLKKYQKSYRAKHNSDEYVFICIEENQDFYGIILKRLRFKMFFDERVVVLNSNHKYENKYLVKIIQNLQKHINEIDYYSELDYPHQLNRPVSNIYLVYFFKWLTIENLEKLFEDEPCDMPLALTKKNLEILKKDYAKILYNLIPNDLRKLANFNVNDFSDC
ncbi:hypothetical protein HCN44_001774 [Aphidius gifuensis]|uniref:Uncharacterized protein n=1 Tax=Aphidius gifuensis TaxID=684658 RepID=A0A835CR41_APHGI|nr:hypothetical protein HCN44_001774 [Aphidius gifuensis]